MKFYQEKYIIKLVPTLKIRNMTINNVLFKLKHSNAKHSLSFLKHTFVLHTYIKAFSTLRYKLTPTFLIISHFIKHSQPNIIHMNDDTHTSISFIVKICMNVYSKIYHRSFNSKSTRCIYVYVCMLSRIHDMLIMLFIGSLLQLAAIFVMFLGVCFQFSRIRDF